MNASRSSLNLYFMEIVYASLSLMNAFIYPLEKNVLRQMWKIKSDSGVKIYEGKNNATGQARI